ncbi:MULTISPECIES: hypothetical protein [unclassified Rhizobium]|uniref:hypothetical protein n=1 Tax=unclassified Rhizobium TaxID=2613769 RepID=UPI001ADBCDD3|nr:MULTISPECIES: hypothetical protein [unclassified Rhizobium]MBO9099970.1 hypothetical protein [Rhizobium sp. L58/93]QXZ82782.1 hypothetical protein J5287_11895 [Rhizobium sp. K1/93]QXZ89705.1 hypothetical protein J5280_16695 [Rhizobium sp. K15/93]
MTEISGHHLLARQFWNGLHRIADPSTLEEIPVADQVETLQLIATEAMSKAPTPETNVSLSEDQISAVLHVVESRLPIVWAKVGAREAFANELRVLEPVSDEEQEVCEACSGIFEEGDPVYWALDGGHIHAECCGPKRESYCGPDGEPLKEGEPIPEPFAWRAGQ